MTHALFHRATPWHAEIRGSTNIFADFFAADGFDISWMQNVTHTGHFLRRGTAFRSWREGSRWKDGTYVFTPFAPIPFMNRGPLTGPWTADASYISAFPSIRKNLSKSGWGAPDLIWTARPGSTILKRLFPRAKLVFQVVDYYPAFRTSASTELELQDYRRADHVFTIGEAITRYLVDDLGIAADKITTLGQGVDLERFEGEVATPADVVAAPEPRAVWVGWLDKIDPPLFDAAARTMSELGGSLLLIGPRNERSRELARRHASVRVLGPKPPSDVASYLRSADIGLMLYDQSRPDVYRGQNPLKLYEYAAAGLAIISTPHREYETLRPPLLEVRQAADVDSRIREALRERRTLGERARRFASERPWRAIYHVAKERVQELRPCRSRGA